MASDLYLGYRNDDADTPFGKFFKPEMAPLPQHVVVALQHGPQAGMALLAFDDAASIVDEGYQQTENGYGFSATAACRYPCAPTCPGSLPRCGHGGSAGTAATPAATSCGTRGPIYRRGGRTATRTAGPAVGARSVTSAAGR